MSEEHKKQLEQQLWNIANTLRGKMNADEFRDYILGFIFYKYLSERMQLYADLILKPDGIVFTAIEEDSVNGKEFIDAIREEALDELGYFLKPSELFSAIAKRGNHKEEVELNQAAESKHTYHTQHNFIIEDVQRILNNIQNSTMGTESEEDFDNLFEDMDLNSTKLGREAEDRNEIIAKVLGHLDEIDFMLEDTERDVLGDAYEYLIGKFASGAGKKAGEFYTPQEVSIVLSKLVTTGKTRLRSVYDPTCGSGSLLLRVAKEVEDVTSFYGQEQNRTTYNLARMNMILHGVHYRDFDIKQEDTLESPQHLEHRFEAIVANPPFSAKWSANQLFMSDDRFSQYGRLAPKSRADFAFVQHMVHHLAENGQMAVVLPHGVLFRGGAEEHIRKYLIKEKNYLDAVIGLPANIFYGTSIPTCILVFKKCKENHDNVLFIDASEYFDKVKTQNILGTEDINRIIATYKLYTDKTKLNNGKIKVVDGQWQNNAEGDFEIELENGRFEIDKYSYVASLNEITENDYNLNIPRYVDTFEEEEPIDIDAVMAEIKSLEAKREDLDKEIDTYFKELGLNF